MDEEKVNNFFAGGDLFSVAEKTFLIDKDSGELASFAQKYKNKTIAMGLINQKLYTVIAEGDDKNLQVFEFANEADKATKLKAVGVVKADKGTINNYEVNNDGKLKKTTSAHIDDIYNVIDNLL